MATRRPRLNVLVTDAELRWMEWYAASSGRPLAEAASRLLSGAIEAERAKPALERAYHDDQRAGPIEREIVADVARAFETPGVVAALADPRGEYPPPTAQAARYLQEISAWITDPRLPVEKGTPPRIDEAPAVVLQNGDIGHPMELIGKTQAGFVTHHGPRGALWGSDKRQLSDLAAQPWFQRYAGRRGEKVEAREH